MNAPDVSNGWQFAALVVVLGFQAYQLWLTSQISKKQVGLEANLHETHLMVNSRLSQLIEANQAKDEAIGMAKGIAQERDREPSQQVQPTLPGSLVPSPVVLAAYIAPPPAIPTQEEIHADPPRTAPKVSPVDNFGRGERE